MDVRTKKEMKPEAMEVDNANNDMKVETETKNRETAYRGRALFRYALAAVETRPDPTPPRSTGLLLPNQDFVVVMLLCPNVMF